MSHKLGAMRNTTLKQLRTFATVARSRTLAAAADTLDITPPAVTIQLRLLEDSIGLPLLERTQRGHQLTAAGHEVLAAAERIDQTLSECDGALAQLSGLAGGTVTLGVVSTAQYFAPYALAAFARAHPALDVRLIIGNRHEIVDALEHFRIDIAIMGRPPDTLDVEANELGPNPHIVVAAPGHRLAGAKEVPLSALERETFLVREKGSGTRTLMEHRLAEANVSPRIGMEIASNETIKQGVMAGLGIAFLSAHTVGAEIADGRLVALDIAGLPVMRTWFLVANAERRPLPAATALHGFLATEGPGFLPRVAGIPDPDRLPAETRLVNGRKRTARTSKR
jgi:DNA-binding transcriptional LysR family regulator